MADIFTGDLTMSDDWGNVVNEQYPNGARASGESVQRFIKQNLSDTATQLTTKAAYFFAIDDEDMNQNVLLAFESEEKYNAWRTIVEAAKENGQSEIDFIEDSNILNYTRLNKSQPVAYDSVLLENRMDSTTIISTDNTVKVRLKFTSTHYEPSGSVLIPSPTGEEGTLIMQRRTGSGSWETRYETTISSIDANDEFGYTEIDLTSYLANGFQEVQIMVTGKTTGLSTTWLKYNVTKTNLGLVFATPWKDAQETNYMQLSYYINGAVDKTLNIKITGPGGNGSRVYTENIGTTVFGENSGTPKKIDIYDSNLYNYKVVTEGVHNIEAWISVNNTNIESEHIHSQVLMIPEATTKSYIIINEMNTNLTNWTNQTLFKYALYSPNGDTMPVSFVLGDYNTDDVYLKYEADSAKCGQIISLTNVIEVETEEDITAKMDITTRNSTGEQVYLLDPFEFFIKNNASYSPTKGADFIFNPKSRNNDEANPKYIANAATGDEVTATWKGFNFTTDGWVKDSDNNKCLRILAGQSVEINYNPFDNWGGDKSCTIEMVVASRNVSSEEHPIISLSRRSEEGGYEAYNGLEVWPTKAIYKTPGSKDDITQDILFREGVPTHIAVNIMHNMYSYTDSLGSHPINLVRIFVNGVINREFAYEEDNLADTGQELTNPRKIIFGAANAGADLDVYSMRIYKSKLSSANILQNYIASLPTTTEKDAVLDKNDILGDDGTISYETVKGKYNTILWKYSENEQKAYEAGEISAPPTTRMVGLAEGNHDDTKKTILYGDLVIRIIKDDGTVDTDRSGTLNDMSAQGQGTSSMGYWKWNQRWVFQKKNEDKDKDGINSKYTTVFTAENPNSPHNGKKAWQPFAGAPFAKKLDAKINWASPMQSHKIGSTGMYNDLWKAVVKDNEITKLGTTNDGANFTGTAGGYADCRVTVGQVPFMVFCQKDKDSTPEFYGLYTMGPSKGDKPTFGYNDDLELFANFSMVEGCDNGALVVTGRVPWNDEDVVLDDKGEIFMYNGVKQYEMSMGETGADYGHNSVTMKNFKEWNRFVYLLNPNLKYFNGKLSDLYKDASLDTEAFYWTTQKDTGLNADAYNVYRYDIPKKKWVNAGIEYATRDDNGVGTDYEIVNLKTQLGINPTGTYDAQNQAFINRRAEKFAERIEEWFDKDDFLFTMCFLKLIAASDNWAKNTYIYNAGFTNEEGKLTSKWRFFQDDLDTIFSLDNSGYKVKPYYVEEHDKKPSDNSNYFNADKNPLYCLAELAWASDLRSMMNRILTAATSLGGSVTGCFDKYYNKIPKYFPQVSYNEITKLLYEDGYVNQKIKNYNSTTNPLAQAVGDQLEAEMEWQRLRSIYISSYAQYGEFSAADGMTSTGALNFRSSQVVDKNGNTQNAAYRFEFTPHMWLYPSMAVGGSSLQANDSSDASGKTKHTLPPRTKSGEKVVFTLDSGDVDGNTQMYIRGINYYNDIGDLGSVATNPAYDFGVGGAKLIQFKATDTGCENGMPFRPLKLGVPSSGMDNIKKFIVRGKVMANTKIVSGALDLSGLWRLEEVDVTATSTNNVTLPTNSNITSLALPATIETLNLSDQQQLAEVSIAGVKNIKNLRMINSPKLKTFNIAEELYANKTALQSCNIDNINWTETPVGMLEYLSNIYDCNLKGIIRVKPGETIDFNLKAQLINKFGDIDDDNNELKVIYTSEPFDTSSARISGESYITVNGDYKYMISVNSGNDFKSINWSLNNTTYATVDAKTGVLTYRDVESDVSRQATLTCSIEILDPTAPVGEVAYYTYKVSKVIYFREKVAELGDYVYSDGSISTQEDYNSQKKVIGICIYVNPKKPSDRLMVALNNLKNLKSYDANTNTYTWNDSYQWGLCTNAMGNSGLITNYYDVANISNTTSGNTTIKVTDIYNADKFVEYNSSVGLGQIGELGVTSTLTTEIPMYEAGDFIPFGQKNTLEIIEHRNKNILKNSNISFTGKRIPGYSNASGSYIDDEMSDLNRILDGYTDSNVNNKLYFYPAASYCYCYKPINNENGEPIEVVDKFKQHNWYLPTLGELARVWYCERAGLMDTAKLKNIYSELGYNVNYWTSTEYSKDNAVYMYDSGSGSNKYIYTTNESKHNAKRIRPVAKF